MNCATMREVMRHLWHFVPFRSNVIVILEMVSVVKLLFCILFWHSVHNQDPLLLVSSNLFSGCTGIVTT